jgi:hypothetical protein
MSNEFGRCVSLLQKTCGVMQEYPPEIPTFNPFAILREPHEEVGLHSRTLAELLSPDGSHASGTAFLREFLRQAGVDNDFSPEGCAVHREKHRIDILITNRQGLAIILENKVYALDQDRQIERYVDQVRQRGLKLHALIYLTLDGHEPSENSRGSYPLAKITCLAYHNDIIPWLEKCEAMADDQYVKDSLSRYRTVVKQLTGRTASRKCIMDIADILLKDDNLRAAMTLGEALVEAKARIQEQFFADIEEAIAGWGLESMPFQKYDGARARAYYGTGNARWWYGIMFRLPQDVLGDVDLALYIEAGRGAVYGLTLVRSDGNRDFCEDPASDGIRHALLSLGDFRTCPGWLGYREVDPPLDFESFSGPELPTLGNEEARRILIRKMAGDIRSKLFAFAEACRADGRGELSGLVDNWHSLLAAGRY